MHTEPAIVVIPLFDEVAGFIFLFEKDRRHGR